MHALMAALTSQCVLDFSSESDHASREWLTRSVNQHRTAATCMLPRQQQSDNKWEGIAWEPSAHGVKRRAKRPCEDDEDDIEVQCASELLRESLCAGQRAGGAALPPRPASPVDDDAVCARADDDDDGDGPRGPRHAAATRRKDKDVIPSRQTWAWAADSQMWQLVLRPRLALFGPFFAFQPIPSKHVDLLRLLLNAPDTPLNETFLREELVPRLNRNHKVSLRALDWLMVDYSCENKAVYMWRVGDTLELVDIHERYTRLLKCWRRRRFDCFRRRHRIYFELDGVVYPTTVAQLHFFYVAARYGFLEYARVYLDKIDAHMKATFTKADSSNAKPARKRKPAAAAAAVEAVPELILAAAAAPSKRQALVTKAKPRAFVNAAHKQWTFRYPDMPSSDEDDDSDDDAHGTPADAADTQAA